MARLYSNENFPQPVVEAVQELGNDVLTSLEAGNANQGIADDEVVRFATAQGRAVVTQNRRHFHPGTSHAGIITCTVDADYRRSRRAFTSGWWRRLIRAGSS